MESWLVDRSAERYLCVRVHNGNDETAMQVVVRMLEDLHTMENTLPGNP